MSKLKTALIGVAFNLFALTKTPWILRKFSKSKGMIFTMHRVLPGKPAAFSPNAILQITPDFLEAFIVRGKKLGFEFISLDDALDRVQSDVAGKPFVVLTFDDAYKDNLEFALPILRKHNCPFTLYVPTAYVDGKSEIWWQALEDIIAGNDQIIGVGGPIATKTHEEKLSAFDQLYWQMRADPEPERDLIKRLALAHGFDLYAHCRELIMDWKELETFVQEPLCTIAAHTVHHYELAKIPADLAREEIQTSVTQLSEKTGAEPRHFSYPIGAIRSAHTREYKLAKDLGMRSAVTTLPGAIYASSSDKMYSLRRVSLNGNYQQPRFIDVFLTAPIFAAIGRQKP